jgi:hypothetical protein
MRDYSRVSPKFWTGHTGREIREKGRDHQVLALYLLTSPQANMIGLYYLPLAYAVHETGISASRIVSVMADLEEVGFCRYDRDSEVVWVINMARLQLGDAAPRDKQRIGAARQYESAPASPLLGLFHDEYANEIPFKSRREGLPKPLARPSEALPIQATAQHSDSTATSTAQRRATSDSTDCGASPKEEVASVWSHWRERNPTVRRETLASDNPEARLIRKRLQSYSAADLCLAIDGLFLDSWATANKCELGWALRQDEKNNNVDRFIRLAKDGPPSTITKATQSAITAGQQWLAMKDADATK